jgi:hypothetical protein
MRRAVRRIRKLRGGSRPRGLGCKHCRRSPPANADHNLVGCGSPKQANSGESYVKGRSHNTRRRVFAASKKQDVPC